MISLLMKIPTSKVKSDRELIYVAKAHVEFLNSKQILLAKRAFAGTRDKDGLTPSMWACRMDNIKHFEMLCTSDNNHIEEADGIERDANGRTWMHWSVRRTMPLECLQVTFACLFLFS